MAATTAERTVWARVRDVIERRGWCQYPGDAFGHITDEEWETGPCCLVQALGVIVADGPKQADLIARLRDRLDRSPTKWNDAAGRSVAEVLDLLDDLDREDRDGRA